MTVRPQHQPRRRQCPSRTIIFLCPAMRITSSVPTASSSTSLLSVSNFAATIILLCWLTANVQCWAERNFTFLPQFIHILSCQHSLPASQTMTRPDISSISFISVRQPGSLRTSPLQVVSAFPLMWQWEMPLPMVCRTWCNLYLLNSSCQVLLLLPVT